MIRKMLKMVMCALSTIVLCVPSVSASAEKLFQIQALCRKICPVKRKGSFQMGEKQGC